MQSISKSWRTTPTPALWFSLCLGALLCAGLLIRFVLQRALLLIWHSVRPK
jgi:hypothetical protein